MAPIDWGLIRSNRASSVDVVGPRSVEAGQCRGRRGGQVTPDRLGLAQALDQQADGGLDGTGHLVDGRLRGIGYL